MLNAIQLQISRLVRSLRTTATHSFISFRSHSPGKHQSELRLFASTVLLVQRSRTAVLAAGELVHAGIVRVVHVVVDAVSARGVGARILAGWATLGGDALDRSVRDTVTASGAGLALEDVVQSKPMADLVDGGQTHVVVGGLSTGKRSGEVDASVKNAIGAGWPCEREVAETEKTAAEV